MASSPGIRSYDDLVSKCGPLPDAAALDPWIQNGDPWGDTIASEKSGALQRHSQQSFTSEGWRQSSTSEGWRQNGWQERNGRGTTEGNET